jgi:superfamily II DNA or RNA helicase
MELYNHQKRFLEKNLDKTALVWSCGTGKTRAAIEWTKLSGDALIICPKPLKANWKRECKKWGSATTNYFVMTKEEFRRDYKSLPGYHSLIIDEVHSGFLTPHFKSQMSKALRNYIKQHNTKRRLFLSATIYSSSPWNIYQLATLLGHKWDWQAFSMAFFFHVKMGSRFVPMVKKGIEKRLAESVAKIADVVDIHECMDVPLQLHTDPEYFALNQTQIKAIMDNYDPVHIVRYTKQHEIENGVLIGDSQGLIKDQFFVSDKMERIKDLVDENKKIAIVCRYNLQIKAIFEELQGGTKPVYVINGAVKNRDEITTQAEKAEECVVLIQADCAEGYQLPSFEVCVFASQSYSYVKFEQVCGRFLRMDKPSRTTFIYLLTEGDSLDQAVFDSIRKKEDFQIALYNR